MLLSVLQRGISKAMSFCGNGMQLVPEVIIEQETKSYAENQVHCHHPLYLILSYLNKLRPQLARFPRESLQLSLLVAASETHLLLKLK